MPKLDEGLKGTATTLLLLLKATEKDSLLSDS